MLKRFLSLTLLVAMLVTNISQTVVYAADTAEEVVEENTEVEEETSVEKNDESTESEDVLEEPSEEITETEVETEETEDSEEDVAEEEVTEEILVSTELSENISDYVIKAEGMMAGVTLNPHTPVSSLEEIIGDLDLVMLMSVNPGFGGQKFIESSVDKTRRLRGLIDRKNATALIEIDGGVNRETAPRLVEAGADVLVAGSAVFKAADPVEEVRILKQIGAAK